jgi:hypothetical protein
MKHIYIIITHNTIKDRRCRDRMIVGFTTTYISNQFLSQLMLWVRISTRTRCTTLCDKVCQWLATGRWFSPVPPVSFTNTTDRHDITESGVKHHQTNKHNNIGTCDLYTGQQHEMSTSQITTDMFHFSVK